MSDNIGSTKFLYAVGVTILDFILVVTHQPIEYIQAFTAFAGIIGGTYVIGNVASKIVTQQPTPTQTI